MKDIPIYDTFSKIEPITKGMSGDKKYYIETVDGNYLLLCIADYSEYVQKKTEYEVMKEMYSRNVPRPYPIDFGVCDDGKSVYTLLSWIEGVEVKAILPSLAPKEQYQLGIELGEIKMPLENRLKKFEMFLIDKCGHDPWKECYAKDEFFTVLKRETKSTV